MCGLVRKEKNPKTTMSTRRSEDEEEEEGLKMSVAILSLPDVKLSPVVVSSSSGIICRNNSRRGSQTRHVH